MAYGCNFQCGCIILPCTIIISRCCQTWRTPYALSSCVINEVGKSPQKRNHAAPSELVSSQCVGAAFHPPKTSRQTDVHHYRHRQQCQAFTQGVTHHRPRARCRQPAPSRGSPSFSDQGLAIRGRRCAEAVQSGAGRPPAAVDEGNAGGPQPPRCH